MSVNTAQVSAGRALEVLRTAWQVQASGGLMTSWMLHGRPGVGKTQVVQTLADEIGARLHDLRLTTIEPQDLRGLPYYDHDAGKTVWYRPEDLPDDPDTPAVLFLDELTAAPPALQPTVYGLLQERRVGRHRLPDSVFVVAAGNTVTDGAVAYDLGTALSDRLVHLHLRADATDWIENFAVPNALSPAVTAFLRSRPDLIETTEDALRRGDMIACTPRSWERVSQIMMSVPDRQIRFAMIAGTVGIAVTSEFMQVADEIAATVNVHDLLETPDTRRAEMFPDTLNGLNAVVFGLVGAADTATIGRVITAMEQIRHLATLRQDTNLRAIPLAEICAFGFEMLMAKALRDGFAGDFGKSDAYANYAKDRHADGLD